MSDKKRVLALIARFNQVEEALGHPDVFEDKSAYKTLTQEHAYLSDVKQLWEVLQQAERELADARELLEVEEEEEFVALLKDEVAALEKRVAEQEVRLHTLLVPPDPTDHSNTIMELRAGTGGDEAALFVGDCLRMYKMYADAQGWSYEELGATPSEVGGYKEYTLVFSGSNVHRFLKHESGTHRVQRVPETEAQGRVHTSAITVAILREPEEEADVVIDEKDLRIDTFRSSGAGGQHVNTTDSAVRLTHIPTGVVAECQQERSQRQNKEKALRHLKAKIADEQRRRQQQEIASSRASQIGSGDRSERIRTYNYPQNRVTDHRINMTRYALDQVMQGQLLDFSQALVTYFHQQAS